MPFPCPPNPLRSMSQMLLDRLCVCSSVIPHFDAQNLSHRDVTAKRAGITRSHLRLSPATAAETYPLGVGITKYVCELASALAACAAVCRDAPARWPLHDALHRSPRRSLLEPATHPRRSAHHVPLSSTGIVVERAGPMPAAHSMRRVRPCAKAGQEKVCSR